MAGVFGSKEDDRESIFALKRQCLMGLPAIEADQTITPVDIQNRWSSQCSIAPTLLLAEQDARRLASSAGLHL